MLLETTIPPLTIVLVLFPVFFAAIWTFVTFILSRMGWADLAEKYTTEQEFEGTSTGWISATINSVNYKNSLVIKYNATGLYLRPVVFFRLFHKPLLIPWNEIKYVRDKKLLFFTFKELIISDPFVASIKLSLRTYGKFASLYEANTAKNKAYIR